MPFGGTDRRTIATVFNSRANSLNAIRLTLALAVIVSHSWALGGFGPEPEAGGARLGTWAVLGFFGISGFLITRSRLSGQSAANYYRGRVLRIFPAFIVCLLFIACVLAPLSLVFDPAGVWSPVDSVTYIVRNLPLYPPRVQQDAIEGTLQHIPYRGVWNGSLWTLFWEAVCYVALGVAGSLLSRRGLKIGSVAVFVAASVFSLLNETAIVPLPELAGRVLPLFAVFAAGAIVFLFANSIRVSPLTVSAAIVMLAGAVLGGVVQSLGALPMIYLIMLLGQVLHLDRVGSDYDLSYGVYIYAWPVQQYVFLIGGNDVPLPVEIVVSIVVAAGLAYLSSRYIEKPALTLKRGPSPAVSSR
jgi:peptidoglycan/LPS O-acetylase OafA/YrhL